MDSWGQDEDEDELVVVGEDDGCPLVTWGGESPSYSHLAYENTEKSPSSEESYIEDR